MCRTLDQYVYFRERIRVMSRQMGISMMTGGRRERLRLLRLFLLPPGLPAAVCSPSLALLCPRLSASFGCSPSCSVAIDLAESGATLCKPSRSSGRFRELCCRSSSVRSPWPSSTSSCSPEEFELSAESSAECSSDFSPDSASPSSWLSTTRAEAGGDALCCPSTAASLASHARAA